MSRAAGKSGSIPVEPAVCIFCESGPTETMARGRDYEYNTTPESFDLERCSSCGLGFIQPRPAAAAMGRIYPSNYYAYNEEAEENRFIKFFRDRIERGKVERYEQLLGAGPANVLDVGCGDGRLLEVLRRFGSRSWHLAGIEIGKAPAARAAARGFEVRSGDFEEIEVADWKERFDLALMHHVIEHTRDPRAAVRKVASLLRPGGMVSIETPELRGWDFELFRERYWGGYHFPRHFYLFTSETLTRLLREQGFDIVSTRSILSTAFWVFSIHNWLVDRAWGVRLARLFHPQNLFAIGAATVIELVQMITRRQSSNLQVLAQKWSA